jgi:hypothetical protein
MSRSRRSGLHAQQQSEHLISTRHPPRGAGQRSNHPKSGAAAPPSKRHAWHTSTMAAGASDGNLPHAVAHQSRQVADESGAATTRPPCRGIPDIHRPPRNLCVEAPPGCRPPTPPRSRGRRPGLPIVVTRAQTRKRGGRGPPWAKAATGSHTPASRRRSRQRRRLTPANRDQANRGAGPPPAGGAEVSAPGVAWGATSGL